MDAAAAAAKSLQSCPTLCDPTDGSPSGSPVPGILQARTLEWAAISFSNAWKWRVKVKSLSRLRLLVTPWTAAFQAPPSMDFPSKSTGVGCHCFLRETHLSGLIILYYSLPMFKGSWSETVHKSVASFFLDNYYICIQQKSLNTYNTFVVSYKKKKPFVVLLNQSFLPVILLLLYYSLL